MRRKHFGMLPKAGAAVLAFCMLIVSLNISGAEPVRAQNAVFGEQNAVFGEQPAETDILDFPTYSEYYSETERLFMELILGVLYDPDLEAKAIIIANGLSDGDLACMVSGLLSGAVVLSDFVLEIVNTAIEELDPYGLFYGYGFHELYGDTNAVMYDGEVLYESQVSLENLLAKVERMFHVRASVVSGQAIGIITPAGRPPASASRGARGYTPYRPSGNALFDPWRASAFAAYGAPMLSPQKEAAILAGEKNLTKLTKDAVEVDDREFEITIEFSVGEDGLGTKHGGTNVVLLFDFGGAMSYLTNDALSDAMDLINELLDLPGVKVGLVPFGGDPDLDQSLLIDLTDDRTDIGLGIANILATPISGSNLQAALAEAGHMFNAVGNKNDPGVRNVVIYLGDGRTSAYIKNPAKNRFIPLDTGSPGFAIRFISPDTGNIRELPDNYICAIYEAMDLVSSGVDIYTIQCASGINLNNHNSWEWILSEYMTWKPRITGPYDYNSSYLEMRELNPSDPSTYFNKDLDKADPPAGSRHHYVLDLASFDVSSIYSEIRDVYFKTEIIKLVLTDRLSDEIMTKTTPGGDPAFELFVGATEYTLNFNGNPYTLKPGESVTVHRDPITNEYTGEVTLTLLKPFIGEYSLSFLIRAVPEAYPEGTEPDWPGGLPTNEGDAKLDYWTKEPIDPDNPDQTYEVESPVIELPPALRITLEEDQKIYTGEEVIVTADIVGIPRDRNSILGERPFSYKWTIYDADGNLVAEIERDFDDNDDIDVKLELPYQFDEKGIYDVFFEITYKDSAGNPHTVQADNSVSIYVVKPAFTVKIEDPKGSGTQTRYDITMTQTLMPADTLYQTWHFVGHNTLVKWYTDIVKRNFLYEAYAYVPYSVTVEYSTNDPYAMTHRLGGVDNGVMFTQADLEDAFNVGVFFIKKEITVTIDRENKPYFRDWANN